MFSAQPQTQQSSFFGGTQTNTGGLFGSTNTPTSTFGATATPAFGQSTSTQGAGTSIAKFNPPQEGETMQKGATTSYVQTKQQCITFMKEYQEKSLEELRIEDYVANRKGPQSGGGTSLFNSGQTSSVFGATQPATGSLFGATQPAQPANNMFGTNTLGGATTNTFGQQNNTFGGGMFGKPLTTPATTASSAFGGFGAAKPLFGAATTSTGFQMGTATPAFGTGASAFGTTNTFGAAAPQQGTSLFGSNTTGAATPFGGLGASTATSSSGFNFQQPNTSTNTGSLFGATAAKPAFGATTFGAPATSQPSTFTGFGQPSATNNLFNQPKPFGATAPTSTGFSFGGTTGGGMFGSTVSQPAGGGLFGSSNPATSNTGGLFGSTNTSSFGGGLNTSGGLGFGMQQTNMFNQSQMNQSAPQQNQEIHQKIMSLASNPYGENELFKGLKSPSAEDSLKMSSPIVQKALHDTSGNFKVATSISSKIKVKPVAAIGSKKSLFDGLEEYDATLEESFSLKSNPKRLIIKPKSTAKPAGNDQSTLNRSVVEENFGADMSQSENFTNQIPLTQPLNEIDNDRRVSWLRTVPSQGIRLRQKDSAVDTTLNQIVGNSNKDSENISNVENMPQTMSAQFNETFRSEEDLTQSEADISTYDDNKEPHPTGIILRRAGYYTIPSVSCNMTFSV